MLSDSSSSHYTPVYVTQRRLLGPDYVLHPADVLCSRGAFAARHPGNRRFKKTIKQMVPRYAKATSKLEKSQIVTVIMDSVRDETPDGGFVRRGKDGNWYELGDVACREKIGQTLRDQLSHLYRSSTKAKNPRRKLLKEFKEQKAKAMKQAFSQGNRNGFQATNQNQVTGSQPSINALLNSFTIPAFNNDDGSYISVSTPIPPLETPVPALKSSPMELSLSNIAMPPSVPVDDIPMPPLGNNMVEQLQLQDEDELEHEFGDLNLTNIFYQAFVVEGINLAA